jgi:hypothetical protein
MVDGADRYRRVGLQLGSGDAQAVSANEATNA